MTSIALDTPKGHATKPKRVRRFCLVTYIDREPLERFLKRSAWIQHYALCTHDRDKLDDGTIKELHTHIVLYTFEAKTLSAIKKNFDRFAGELVMRTDNPAQNTLVQDCHDVTSQYRYLRHLDDPDKVQYEECEVFTDNDSYWKELCRTNGLNDSSSNTGLQMFDDICEGVSTREMILRYGKEYIYHCHNFKEVVKDHVNEITNPVKSEAFTEVAFKAYVLNLINSNPNITKGQIKSFFQVLDYVIENTKIEDSPVFGFYFTEKEKEIY